MVYCYILFVEVGIKNCKYMYPTTVFIDENGNQRKVIVVARTEEEWIDEIEEVLAGEE